MLNAQRLSLPSDDMIIPNVRNVDTNMSLGLTLTRMPETKGLLVSLCVWVYVCVRACLCTWMFVWGEFSQISKDIGCYNTLRCFHLTCVLSPEGLCNRRVVHSGLSAVAVRTTTQECVQNSVRSSEPSPPSPLLSSVRPPLMLWMLKHGWVRKRFVKGQTVVSTWYTNSPWCRPGPKLKAQFGLHRKWVVYLFDLIWGSSGTQQRQSTF